MENRYKIIISNKNLYKEIELADDAGELKVGTGIDCGTDRAYIYKNERELVRHLFGQPLSLLR